MKSQCCNAALKVVSGDEGTAFYQCSACLKASDPVVSLEWENNRLRERNQRLVEALKWISVMAAFPVDGGVVVDKANAALAENGEP